ncbi:MAG: RNA pyrophosphohydrolase [Candidatus Anoxychlamydiales bacterium]|nr:RNA pyrophosphohydrolase [Candidatus Anoxychlamydiales bacterium]NGX40529.1 RNA pyrophosphohydrolase [Candidatus Anoxychlamydiales bacterium]
MNKKDESVISCIFSEDRKKVLLIKRRDVPVWTLPGGGVEDNETIEEAITREILEETGFQTKIKKKVGEYSPINKLAKFTHLFECEIVSGVPTLSDETRDIKNFDVDDLPKLVPPPYPEWVEDSFKDEKKMIKRKLKSVNYLTLAKNLILHPILVSRFLLAKIGLRINS